MLPVVWLDQAISDLTEIITFIASHNPAAAQRLKSRLETAPVSLAEHPYLFPSGRVAGTREMVVHPNYILVYRVGNSRVEIVSLLHSRKDYPPL